LGTRGLAGLLQCVHMILNMAVQNGVQDIDRGICCFLRMCVLYAFNMSMQLLSSQKEILLKTKIE
jgi:hypothetical protein